MGCSLSLSRKAYKGSSFFVKVIVKDEYKRIVTPTSLKWTLKDSDGNIVNGRSNVIVTPSELAETNVISLYGNDLYIADTLKETRMKIIVEGTYISEHMSNAKYRSAAFFTLVNPDYNG